MDDREYIQMLTRTGEEIKALRYQVAELRPKAEAYGAICTILGLIPQPAQGYGEDIMWIIEREKLSAKERIDAEIAARAKPSREPADEFETLFARGNFSKETCVKPKKTDVIDDEILPYVDKPCVPPEDRGYD